MDFLTRAVQRGRGIWGKRPGSGQRDHQWHTIRKLPASQGEGVHILVVKKEIRDRAGVTVGDVAEVTLERETEPRQVEAPEELADALRSRPGAQAVFDKLGYSHRKAYCDHVAQAKRAETRQRRAAKCVELLLEAEAMGLSPRFRRSNS